MSLTLMSTIGPHFFIVLNQLGDPDDFNVCWYGIIVRPQVLWRQHLGWFVVQQVPAETERRADKLYILVSKKYCR